MSIATTPQFGVRLSHHIRAEVIMLIILYSEFPVILLHYAPNSMHYSQDYSQNHYQNSVVTLKMMLYCNA